jgi:dolichyl-phosphate beta-glucosyltransferase
VTTERPIAHPIEHPLAPTPTPDTILVVPCYEEAARLRSEAFVDFAAAHARVGFHFVDDGSRDQTAALLGRLAARDPKRFTFSRLPENRGKAEAVRQGMLAALRSGPRFAGYWDADLSTPLEELPAFLELLERRPELDVVLGARVKLLGRAIERRALRHYPGRVFATFASLTLRLAVYDTQCGAKLFRASPAVAALFEEPFLSRWIFDVEILARWLTAPRDAGAPPPEQALYELPLRQWRDTGDSRVRVTDYARAALDLLRIRRRYRR